MSRILVTGGAGFIGSHVCEALLARGDEVICLDNLTYAGSADNLDRLRATRRFGFVKGDIADAAADREALAGVAAVINCAAETHVDRSLLTPARFAYTDVYGVATLLEAARDARVERFVQVSTDEVYGPMAAGEATEEETPLRPTSPYAASKAGGDLLARAFAHTYGIDVRVTRGCNAYGPRQHPEKFIPLMTVRALSGERLPVYGDGLQEREWCYVTDHASAILGVLDRGEPGAAYNIGTGERIENGEVVRRIIALTGRDASLVEHVIDRPGHDRRYAVDARRLRALGWRPAWRFEHGLAETVAWYRENDAWWHAMLDASREYFERMYTRRGETLAPR